MKKIEKINLRLNFSEKRIIEMKAFKSGCSVSEFLRSTALDYPLSYKLTDDEIKVYKQLNKFSRNFININNLFKKGDITGVKEKCIETADLIQQHLKKLQ
jgi:hypothetical protein